MKIKQEENSICYENYSTENQILGSHAKVLYKCKIGKPNQHMMRTYEPLTKERKYGFLKSENDQALTYPDIPFPLVFNTLPLRSLKVIRGANPLHHLYRRADLRQDRVHRLIRHRGLVERRF